MTTPECILVGFIVACTAAVIICRFFFASDDKLDELDRNNKEMFNKTNDRHTF